MQSTDDRVECDPIGVQPLHERYGERTQDDDYSSLPEIWHWRCNLTALSHTHNLYFVAHGRHIYVYHPQFPTQRLPEHPLLIVSSQPSIPGKSGYLSNREPHAINNLLVQHLGADEVVATVRDDGDVDVILVRHIVQAIERRDEPGSALSVEAEEIRPIFQDNVGVSAWGLAIHSTARILAISSNFHEVRVFKFGLLEDGDTTSYDARESNSDSDSVYSDTTCDDRQLDVTQRIINGDANIPHIAFCNTGDDPGARWLLTTDIDGYCRVLDLHDPSARNNTAHEFRLGPHSTTLRSGVQYSEPVGAFDRTHAGWGFMFLDRRSFNLQTTWLDACSLPPPSDSPNVERPGIDQFGMDEMIDISDTVTSIRNKTRVFRPHQAPSSGENDLRSTDGERGSLASPTAATVPNTAQSPHATAMRSQSPLSEGVQLPRGREEEYDADEYDDDDEMVEYASDSDEHLHEHDVLSRGEDIGYLSANDDRWEIPLLSSFNPDYAPTTLCQGLPCPLLHTSVKHIYLLQPSDPKRPGVPTTGPMITLRDPLHQKIHEEWDYLSGCNRLNMHAYIPEIGVVIVASQTGRAAVLSLNKAMRRSLRGEKRSHMCYAMRLEHILPYGTQERQNKRPPYTLHGIAAGPMQGTEKLPLHQKRWRLMMMYQDHSVLSYEIRRGSRTTRPDMGIDSLVV